jgi:hypothetical protein
LAVPRPGWLGAGALRLGALSLFVVLVAMLRPRLTPYAAGWVVLAGGLCMVGGGVLFALRTRSLALRLPLPGRAQRATDATFLLLRRLGLPLLGLAFFLFWTFVYMGLWWAHPPDAFRGLGESPRFADFFYTAVSTAFISPPGDILAHSRGARAATMIEMMTSFALVTAYASSFIDLRRSGPDPAEPV